MADAVKALDDQIRKLQALRDALQDPALEGMVRSIFSNGTVKVEPTQAVKPSMKTEPSEGLAKAVRDAVHSQEGEFSHQAILAAILKTGFQLNAKHKGVAVSGALRRMAERGQIEKVGVTEGGGFIYKRKS